MTITGTPLIDVIIIPFMMGVLLMKLYLYVVIPFFRSIDERMDDIKDRPNKKKFMELIKFYPNDLEQLSIDDQLFLIYRSHHLDYEKFPIFKEAKHEK